MKYKSVINVIVSCKHFTKYLLDINKRLIY